MKANWDRVITHVLLWEGGYADRPEEVVNHGVTLASWKEFHPHATKDDIRRLNEKQAAEFFKLRYASKIDFDSLPSGLDAVMLHGSIMFGIAGMRKMAEKAKGDWGYLIALMMQNKMHREDTAWRFMQGWSDRFIAIYELASTLARGGPNPYPNPRTP